MGDLWARRRVSRAEMEQRVAAGALWLVIDGLVVDASGFVLEHPGGPGVLQAMRGKDATRNFRATGHSSHAQALVQKLAVGVLDDTVGTADGQASPDAPAAAAAAAAGDRLGSPREQARDFHSQRRLEMLAKYGREIEQVSLHAQCSLVSATPRALARAPERRGIARPHALVQTHMCVGPQLYGPDVWPWFYGPFCFVGFPLVAAWCGSDVHIPIVGWTLTQVPFPGGCLWCISVGAHRDRCLILRGR